MNPRENEIKSEKEAKEIADCRDSDNYEETRRRGLDKDETGAILEFGQKLIEAVSKHKAGPIEINLKPKHNSPCPGVCNIWQLYGRSNFFVMGAINPIKIPAEKVEVFKPYINYLKNSSSDIAFKLPYMIENMYSSQYREDAKKIKPGFLTEVANLDFRQPSAYHLKPGQELSWSKDEFQIIPDIVTYTIDFCLDNPSTGEYIYITRGLNDYRVYIMKNTSEEAAILVTDWAMAKCGDELYLKLDEKSGYKRLYWHNPKPIYNHPESIKFSYLEKDNGEKIQLKDADMKKAQEAIQAKVSANGIFKSKHSADNKSEPVQTKSNTSCIIM